MRLLPVLAILAGCSTSTLKQVNMPTAVACVDSVPERPTGMVTDAEMKSAKASNGARWIALKNWQDASVVHMRDLEAIARACATVATESLVR